MSVASILAEIVSQVGSIAPPYVQLDIQTRIATMLYNSLQKGATAGASSPAAGQIGERIVSFLPRSSATALSNGVAKTVTSIPLTAGDWDINISCGFTPGTTGTYAFAGIGTVTNTSPTADQYADRGVTSIYNLPNDTIIALGGFQVSIAAPATYYLIAQAGFTGASSAYGRISARRMS